MKNLFLIVFLFVSLCSWAARPRNRFVRMDTVCHCSVGEFQHVVDSFFYQFQTGASDSIFEWAYLNTGGDGNTSEGGKDAVRLHYTTATYDHKTRTGDQALDIYVLGSKMFPDRHLITVSNGGRMDLTYSGALLDDANIIFKIDSVAPTTTRVKYEFNIVFGGFVAMFISDKTWHGAMRWRIEQLLKNFVECAETGTVKQH